MKFPYFKHLLPTACLIAGTTFAATAQVSFSHALGAALYGGGDAGSPAILYSPRLNVVSIGNNLTVSVGTHAGLWLAFNSREGASGLAFDLPLVAELNFGHKSSKGNETPFGGYVGAGYGFSQLASEGEYGIDENKASGPVFNGGLRFSLVGRSFGLRGSYLLNLKATGANVIGLGLEYNF